MDKLVLLEAQSRFGEAPTRGEAKLAIGMGPCFDFLASSQHPSFYLQQAHVLQRHKLTKHKKCHIHAAHIPAAQVHLGRENSPASKVSQKYWQRYHGHIQGDTYATDLDTSVSWRSRRALSRQGSYATCLLPLYAYVAKRHQQRDLSLESSNLLWPCI